MLDSTEPNFDGGAFPQVAWAVGPGGPTSFTMKTYSPKPDHIERRWYVMDAGEQVLGRVATEAAVILRGKHKPIFAPHMDVGDHLIIINAAKVVLTGGKETKKIAWRHSGHPGGITGTLYEDLLAKKPAFAVEKAVRGMLPKNRLGRAMIKKLHVVPGPEHHHQAQKPVDWTIGMRPAWEGLPTPATAPANGKKKAATRKDEPEAAAAAPRKPAARKTTAQKTAATKPTGTMRTATKKPTSAKTTSQKTAAKKTTATKKPTAAKKTTARKTTARKPAATSTRKKKET
jgi:large subunit ribosomal protein L13